MRRVLSIGEGAETFTEDMLTMEEAAEYLDVSPAMLWEYYTDDPCEGPQFASFIDFDTESPYLLYRREDLDEWTEYRNRRRE